MRKMRLKGEENLEKFPDDLVFQLYDSKKHSSLVMSKGMVNCTQQFPAPAFRHGTPSPLLSHIVKLFRSHFPKYEFSKS